MARNTGHDADPLLELLHAVWLAKKMIELVCSAALAQAAQDYTEELARTSREPGKAGASREVVAVSARERLLRRKFMEAARREMGYTGEPLTRRAGTEEATVPEADIPASLQANSQ